VETVVHARILQEVVTMDGFAEIHTRQIRVFTPGMQELFEERVDPKNKNKLIWVSVETLVIDLPFVPLVTFYAEKDGAFSAKPPLMDLADLNIAHWQSCSDQRSILTAARFPLLAMSGGSNEESNLIIGPYNFLHTADPQARFYYVEHTGAAIAAGRQDLLDLEEQMAHYGAEFLTKRPGRETATARALDSAEATSPLQDMTVRFMDAVNHALSVTAAWLKVTNGGTVTISTDFGPEESDQSDMNVLKFTRRLGDISRETYLTELQRRGVLADTFDLAADLKQIFKEVEEGLSKLKTGEEEEEGLDSQIGETGTGTEQPSGGGIAG